MPGVGDVVQTDLTGFVAAFNEPALVQHAAAGQAFGLGIRFHNPDHRVELAQQKLQARASRHGGLQHAGIAAQGVIRDEIGTRQHKAKAFELTRESVGYGHAFIGQGALRLRAELGAALVQGCRHEKKAGVQPSANPQGPHAAVGWNQNDRQRCRDAAQHKHHGGPQKPRACDIAFAQHPGNPRQHQDGRHQHECVGHEPAAADAFPQQGQTNGHGWHRRNQVARIALAGYGEHQQPHQGPYPEQVQRRPHRDRRIAALPGQPGSADHAPHYDQAQGRGIFRIGP